MKRLFIIISILVLTVLSPVTSSALTGAEIYDLSAAGALFYVPKEEGTGCYGTLSGSTLYEKVLSYLLSTGLNEVGAAGIYGNMMREGLGGGVLLSHENGVDSRDDIGTWYTAATYYGPNGLHVREKDVRDLDDPDVMHGLGFIQWSFGRRVNFLNALADAGGLDKYAREWDDINGRYVYDSMTYDQLVDAIGRDTTDAILIAELEFFNSEHENNSVTQNDINAQGLSRYGVTSGMNIFDALNLLSTPEEAAELFFTTSEMPGATRFNSTGQARANSARDGYDLIMSAGITSGGATNCSKKNSSIVETALSLAWNRETEGRHAKNDPKPEYVTAMQQVGTYGPAGIPAGASCDYFVATVMRYSGADPDYPLRAVASEVGPSVIAGQREHMLSHPEMYEEIPNLGNASNLQAGDIFVIPGGHTLIFMGIVDGKWMQASASYNSRTGEYFSYEEYSNRFGSYRIFRRI